MKKLLIFISIMATNPIFASPIKSETLNKQETIDILIKNGNLIEKELSPNRLAPISRELSEERVLRMGRGSREVRENRIVRMGRNSRNIRQERIVHIIHSIPKKKQPSTKTTTVMKKNYLSNLMK